MPRIKLVIFDLDGTLVDAYPAIIASFNYTMRRLNYPLQRPSTIRQAVGWGDENLLKPFLKRKDLKRGLRLYRHHHKTSLLKGARLFPKVGKVLNYLKKKGYHLAVASNRPTRFSGILIRHLRLEKYFAYVLCADRLAHIKPHPEILLKIMQRFQVKPEQALYVGDMTIDAQAGKRAGVKTIIVSTGSSTKYQIQQEQPYRKLKKLGDLLKIL